MMCKWIHSSDGTESSKYCLCLVLPLILYANHLHIFCCIWWWNVFLLVQQCLVDHRHPHIQTWIWRSIPFQSSCFLKMNQNKCYLDKEIIIIMPHNIRWNLNWQPVNCYLCKQRYGNFYNFGCHFEFFKNEILSYNVRCIFNGFLGPQNP